MTRQTKYNKMWTLFINGKITKQCWVEYCDTILDEILYENRDMFIRLKYRQ